MKKPRAKETGAKKNSSQRDTRSRSMQRMVRALKVAFAWPILFIMDALIAWSGVEKWDVLRAETRYRLKLGYVTSKRPNDQAHLPGPL